MPERHPDRPRHSKHTVVASNSELGSGRVAYGSDTPFELMYLEVAKYTAFLEKGFTPEDRDNLMWRTISGVLGV